MKNKIYCLASAKGGSGKTVLCASFAAFLAELGKKVLILDVDEATHGLTLLYLNEVSSRKEDSGFCQNNLLPKGLFDGEGFSWEKDVIQLPNNVHFVPATFSFNIKERSSATDLHSMLISILDEAKQKYDYIFLDAQAGLDSYSQVAMSKDISHEVVIVSEYDPISAAGVERLKMIMRDDLLYVRTWILLNKMLPDFVNTFSDFMEISKYLTPIPWDPDVVRAYARRRLPLDLAYGNPFTLAIMQTLKRLLGPEASPEIDQWANGRASNIREPIEDQYRDAEKELKGLMERKVFLDKRIATRRLMWIMPFAMVVPIVLIALFLVYDRSGLFSYGKLNYVSKFVTATVTVLVGMLTVVFLYMTKLWDKSAERKVEESRFTRQLNIVEDKLKRLEVLRKADLETLIKEGSSKK